MQHHRRFSSHISPLGPLLLTAGLLGSLNEPALADASRTVAGPVRPATPSSTHGLTYLSPKPGAGRVSPHTTIAFRRLEEAESSGTPSVRVRGSSSGLRSGTLGVCDDERTFVYRPGRPFDLGERVSVRIEHPGSSQQASYTFSFTVGSIDPATQPRRPTCALGKSLIATHPPEHSEPTRAAQAATSGELPDDYPAIEVLNSNNPDPGVVLFSPFKVGGEGHLVMLDNRGEPLFYRNVRWPAFDFKMQDNGLFTYWSAGKYYALDATFAPVDSFSAGNGYLTDLHELQLLPNGNALLMIYDPQPVGMDTVVAGGNPDAIVTGLVIQELDPAKNVVFQWRSWDHFEIIDAAIPGGESLTDSLIDYVHGNSIDLDTDGNLLISSRHLEEITKIDRQTGDVIWRFGQNALNNDFSIIQDPRGFSHQHDARRLPNGNISVFDNGNLNNPQYSRVVEYKLNENGMNAKLEWEYRTDPDTYSVAMGNAQRRDTGGTTICWGTAADPQISEIHADGTEAFRVRALFFLIYRAFRHPWTGIALDADTEAIDFGIVSVGDTALASFDLTNNTADDLTVTHVKSTGFWFQLETPLPVTLTPGETRAFDARFTPFSGIQYEAALYIRSVTQDQLIAEVLEVSGIGDGPVAVSELPVPGPAVELFPGYPNPFTASTAIAFSLPGSESVSLRVFDPAGRLVRTLASGVMEAGTHRCVWDGRDDAGRPAGNGVFFYRLEGNGFERTQRVLRLN